MSQADTHGTPTLNEIECHVAWLYSTALRVMHALPSCPNRHQRLLRHVLRRSEALKQIIARLNIANLDQDLAVDMAVILIRALDLWAASVERWHAEPKYAALAASATELADVGEVLQEALASAPWVERDQQISTLSMPLSRRVQ